MTIASTLTSHADARVLSELDHVRLLSLVQRQRPLREASAPLRALEDLLDLCDAVPVADVGVDTVTMRSSVRLRDLDTHTERTLTLSYPDDADEGGEGGDKLSVLSPLGVSLLGARLGEALSWRGPRGEAHRAQVLAIVYQPESAGDVLR